MATSNQTKGLRVGGTLQQQSDDLGPLAQLVGTWIGNKGVNVVAVPKQGGDFTLIGQTYTETITFTPVHGLVPNRRNNGATAFIGALKYDLTIKDTSPGSHMETLHAENGMWLFQHPYQTDKEYFPIIRQSCIPHGNMVTAPGKSSVINGAPDFNSEDIKKFAHANPDSLPKGAPPIGYDSGYGSIIPGTDGVSSSDASKALAQAIKGQNIVKTTLLEVDTNNQGGVLNINYIKDNADTPWFGSKFWIEEIEENGRTTLQLQYIQKIKIKFLERQDGNGLVAWPHVDVNTLRKH